MLILVVREFLARNSLRAWFVNQASLLK